MPRLTLLAAGLVLLAATSIGAEKLVQLNGQTSFVETQDVKFLSSGVFSLSVWVWPDQESDELQAIFGIASNNLKYTMTLGWGAKSFYYTDGIKEEPIMSNSTFPRKAWYHVALTFEVEDRGQYSDPHSSGVLHRTGKLYVNGALEAEFETRLFDMSKVTLIGGAEYKQYAKQRHFSGLMDELRVYGTTLSAEDAGELSFTKQLALLRSKGLVWDANFNEFRAPGYPESLDIRDKIAKARNFASTNDGDFSVEVAYCDSVTVAVMPYDSIPLLSSNRDSPYASDPAVAGATGPMMGTSLTITGKHFANSPFTGVSMQPTDGPTDEWAPLAFTYVDHKTLHVVMPEMAYQGTPIDVTIRVTNGGTAYPTVNYQTIGFTYDYTLGEDWVAGLKGVYTLDSKSWDATAMTWDNIANRSDTASRVKKVANYGGGGPFLAAGRNSVDNTGLTFAIGERVELAPLHSSAWTACLWVYVKEGSDVIMYEINSSGHSVRNSLAVSASGELSLDRVAAGASIRLNAWQFVCVSRGSEDVRFYASGVLSGSAAAPPVTATTPMAKTMLGKTLLGMVDDLWVWGRQLEAHEVASMYAYDKRSVALQGAPTSHFSAETSTGVFDSTAWASDATKMFSVQVWLKPDDIFGTQPILQIPVPVSTTANAVTNAAISHGLYIGLVDGHVIAQLPRGDDGTGATAWGNAITDTASVPPAQWSHVTVVYTSTKKLEIYVDGVQQLLYAAAHAASAAIGSFSPNTGSVFSLQQPPSGSSFPDDLYTSATGSAVRIGYAVADTLTATDSISFKGSVGEVHLWSMGLSSSVIANTFVCTPEPTASGLFASFLLDESVNSILISSTAVAQSSLTYSGPKDPFWGYADYGEPANTTVWNLSELAGSSTKLATAGVGGSFTFQDRSFCKRLKKTGGDSIQLALVGPLDRHTSLGFGTCEDHMDGTYTCAYNSTICGYYALRLEDASVPVEPGAYSEWTSTSTAVLGVQGSTQGFLRSTTNEALMAKGTPAKLYVHPGPTWAPKSYVWEDSDWLEASDLEEAHKAVPATFNLQAADYWGCPRTTGGDQWEVRTYGRYEQEGSVVDNGDGSYKLSYVPHIIGSTYLSVSLDGEHVDTDAESNPHAQCSWSLASDTHGSPWCVDVKPGQGSMEFDGVNHVTVPHADSLTLDEGWTVDVWVWPRATAEPQGKLFRKQSPTSGKGYWMGFVEGHVEVGLYIGAEEFRILKSSTAVQPGKWTHLAVVYTGDTLKLYVNGQLKDMEAYDRSTSVRENNQPMVIGEGYYGVMDELRFFKEDISQHIVALHKCPAEPAMLAAYFSFNDGPGAAYAHDYFGLEGQLFGYNVSNAIAPNSEFNPVWSTMHAPSDYAVVDYTASVATSFLGDGLVSAVAGIPTTFSFRFWDKCGFDFVSDEVEVTASMVADVYANAAHDAMSYPLESFDVVTDLSSETATANCTSSSTFQSFYTAPTCGTVRLSVELAGEMVTGFPLDLAVDPHPATSAVQSVVVGLHDSVAGLETSFQVHAKDMFGCQRSSGGDDFVVVLTRTSLGLNPDGVMFAGPDIVTLTLEAEDHGDGTYTVEYTAPAPGNYTVYVGLLGTDGLRHDLQGEDSQPLRFMTTSPPWRAVHVEGDTPDVRYRTTTVKNDDYVYVFRGFSADKEGLMDVWRYPLAREESWLYRAPVMVSDAGVHAVRVVVDTAALITEGKMRSDCGDVLFKTKAAAGWEGEAIGYWTDPYPGCNTQATVFWLVPTSAELYMFYGNPEAEADLLSPSELFLLWEDFEGAANADTGLPVGWSFAETCSIPSGDPATFSTSTGPVHPWHGSSSLQVDAVTRLGGALMAPVPSQQQFILKAAFYDSDSPASSHWISPNYDDCTTVDNAKEMLYQGHGVGVFTSTKEDSYAVLYPWRTTSTPRTAGWHVLEMVSDGTTVDIYIDNDLKATAPSGAPLDKVLIRGGGPDPDVPLESIAAWDNVLVAAYNANTDVEIGPEEAVLYNNRGFHRLYTFGTHPPPRTAASAVVYEDKVYLLGGYGTYGSFADSGATRGATSRTDADDLVWTYDLISKVFATQIPWGTARPSPRFEHVTGLHAAAATIYLFGGRDATTGALLSDTWAYSIDDAAWTNVSAAYGPSGRFSATAVGYKHIVLVFGGLTNEHDGDDLEAAATNELWAFNTVTMSWSDLTPKWSPSARYGHAATVNGGSMYVYGGYDNRQRFADAWKYDIDYNRWTLLRADPGYSMPAEKSSVTAVAHDDMLLVFGGQESTVESYTSDMWGINVF